MIPVTVPIQTTIPHHGWSHLSTTARPTHITCVVVRGGLWTDHHIPMDLSLGLCTQIWIRGDPTALMMTHTDHADLLATPTIWMPHLIPVGITLRSMTGLPYPMTILPWMNTVVLVLPWTNTALLLWILITGTHRVDTYPLRLSMTPACPFHRGFPHR